MVKGLSFNIGDKYDKKYANVKLQNGEKIQILDRNHDGKIDEIIIKNKPQKIDNRNMLVFEDFQDNDYNGKTDSLDAEARIQKSPSNYAVMYSKHQNILTGEREAYSTYKDSFPKFLLNMTMPDKPEDKTTIVAYKRLTNRQYNTRPDIDFKKYSTSGVLSDKEKQAHLKETGVDITNEMTKIDKLFPLNSQ